MAYDILAGKELSCNASKVEIANDDHLIMITFKNILFEQATTFSIEKLDNNVQTSKNKLDYFSEDVVYCINDDGEVEIVSKGEPPTSKFFDRSKVKYYLYFYVN